MYFLLSFHWKYPYNNNNQKKKQALKPLNKSYLSQGRACATISLQALPDAQAGLSPPAVTETCPRITSTTKTASLRRQARFGLNKIQIKISLNRLFF